MSDDAFDDYLERWREADPARVLAWHFLSREERIRDGGLAALQEEWLKATREVAEAQVAATKLGWWREEMQRACAGEARHPLVIGLFADARIRAVPVANWTAAIDAALLALDTRPAPDFATQREVAAPLARAFAALEIGVAYGPSRGIDKAATAIALTRLVGDLRSLPGEVGHGRSPLPMNLLARHGLTLEDLLEPAPERQAALRDYVLELQRALAEAAKMDGLLTLLRTVQVQSDLRSLAAAAQADDPLAGLQPRQGGWRQLLKTWRAARISRHDQLYGNANATT